MKIRETITETVLIEISSNQCNADLGWFCHVHFWESGTHISFAEEKIEYEVIVERPATTADLIEFIQYQRDSKYLELQRKFPEYRSKDWNWFNYFTKWIAEAGTNTDPVSDNTSVQ